MNSGPCFTKIHISLSVNMYTKGLILSLSGGGNTAVFIGALYWEKDCAPSWEKPSSLLFGGVKQTIMPCLLLLSLHQLESTLKALSPICVKDV